MRISKVEMLRGEESKILNVYIADVISEWPLRDNLCIFQ